MSKNYLYAAAVQGIQDFIFRTNTLKHIIGASELVERICTKEFEEFEEAGKDPGKDDERAVVRAAGNIKYIYSDPDKCKKAFREFPRKIMTLAPGITISQAVVEYDGDDSFQQAVNRAEQLLKTQRNKAPKSVLSGLMGIKRANDTGLPATRQIIEDKKPRYLDDASVAVSQSYGLKDLCEKCFGTEKLKDKQLAWNISDMTGKNDWIAIIHADGNGVGQVVQNIGQNRHIFQDFSRKLATSTQVAAQQAFEKVSEKFEDTRVIPIRPVVLSGDDLTVIIRGDLALEYTRSFIDAFEKETKNELGSLLQEHTPDRRDHLTACAGIAFIKSSYPFYYGYQLAEELCSHAKNDAKNLSGENALPPSCLMFHKIQDSFIIDYEAIIARELSVPDKEAPLFKAGPYYLTPQHGRRTVEDVVDFSEKIEKESESGIKNGIRNWISLRLKGNGQADQRKERIRQMASRKGTTARQLVENLTDEKNGTCIAYDVLAYYSIMNQQTKDEL